MFSKQKVKITYVIIALIGLIALWYLFKPKTNFDSCYEKCIKITQIEEVKRPALCISVCANTK